MKTAALYLRLSSEDERGGVSESIENQRYITRECAKNHGYEYIEYIDDGISGVTFERAAFKRMIEDIESGIINAVIVKDHSRLGRNLSKTQYYFEQYFPEHNVKYIAVNDGIERDPLDFDYDDDMRIDFLALINQFYPKDISKKVRSALTAKRLNGQFIGSDAPYGYKKSKDDKNKLAIDEETAPVVRCIYSMFLKTAEVSGIASYLTESRIPTPSMRLGRPNASGRWNGATVRNILTSECYIGNLVQAKVRKQSYKSSRRIYLPSDYNIRAENTHEAIISKEDYYRVQDIFAQRKRKHISEHPLKGMCFCADCGGGMTFMKSGANSYMVCSGFKKGKCKSHIIREDEVERTAGDLHDIVRIEIGEGKKVDIIRKSE